MRMVPKAATPKINERNLRSDRYTQSLLSEARRLRVIDAEQKNAVESRIAAFARLLSPVPQMTEECTKSVWYTLDTALHAMQNPDLALYRLRIWRIAELYAAGQRILRRLFVENIALLVRVRRSRLSLPNLLYQQTLDTEIPAFLRQYDRRLGAHRAYLELPYQISQPVSKGKMEGLGTLRKYLRALDLENQYCRRFPTEELEALYLAYCFRYEIFDFESPAVNFFRLCVLHAIFAEYLQCGQDTLAISEADAQLAQRVLGTLTEGDRRTVLGAACDRIIDRHITYYAAACTELLETAYKAIRTGTLPKLLITQ